MKQKKYIATLLSLGILTNLALAANSTESGINIPKKKATQEKSSSTKPSAKSTQEKDKTPSTTKKESATTNISKKTVIDGMNNKIILNFDNVDIQTVIKAISKISGKNFVIDPRVKGTVNIVSDQPVSKKNSYLVLATALRMQGFATVENNGVVTVLPENDGKFYGSDGNSNSIGDQLVTKVFNIQNGSPVQIANVIRPLISPNNVVTAVTGTTDLVVTDYAPNIRKISNIINQIENNYQAKDTTLVSVPLKHAIAADVIQTLQPELQSTQGINDGQSLTMYAEPNSNSIILNSSSKARMDRIIKLIKDIDGSVGSSNNNLHVVYLKNAQATHVADVLRVVASGQENPDLQASGDNSKFTTSTTSMFSSGGAPSSSGGSKSGKAATYSTGKDYAKVFIQAEPSTNSLIIQAPEALYQNLRNIIAMLDIRRTQIKIEALIAEVADSQAGDLGVQWITGIGNNNGGAVVLSNYGGSGSLSSLASSAGTGYSSGGVAGAALGAVGSLSSETYIGIVGPNISVGGTTIPGIGAIANMISSNGMGNVISRPVIMTLDNEEAQIMVGQNIGVPSGSYSSSSSGSVSPFTTVDRKDVGTMLKIKPLVTQNGTIQLTIYQEDSQVDNSVATSSNGPTITKRNISTNILANDGQLVALGGMTTDQISIKDSGIPGLKDIPLIGWLFSWKSNSKEKKNLVLFLKPQILKTAEDTNNYSQQRSEFFNKQQQGVASNWNLLLPNIDPVTIDNQLPFKDIPSTAGDTDTTYVDTPLVDKTYYNQ